MTAGMFASATICTSAILIVWTLAWYEQAGW
jgi:hypothetical protein